MSLNHGYVYREQLGRCPDTSALAYLSHRYPHASPAEWRDRFVRGEVRIEGVIALGTEILRPGQTLAWHRPPWEEPEAAQSFEVVHEDEAVLAVVKPSGLPTMPSGGFLENTLLYHVRARWPEAAPLHRLGRATSGLVLFARTHDAAAAVSRSWRDGEVEKRYRALSQGRAAQLQYEIDAPIGLVPHPLLGSVHGASILGKRSRSTATRLELRDEQTLFEVQIHTGRPDQIRIHLAFIGHPLAGDPMFDVGGVPRTEAPGLPGDGGYLLHAISLGFVHPSSGERMHLEAPAPPALRPLG